MCGTARKLFLVTCLTAATGALVLCLAFAAPLRNDKLFSFPLALGDWHGTESAMEDWVFESLETEFAFMRDYTSPRFSRGVNLAMVWYDDRNVGFHAPEACLGGVGNTVTSMSPVELQLDVPWRAVRLLARQGRQVYVVLYFYMVGDEVALNAFEVRWALLKRRLQAKRGAAVLVRLMTPIRTTEPEADAVLADFLNRIRTYIPEHSDPDLIGPVTPSI